MAQSAIRLNLVSDASHYFIVVGYVAGPMKHLKRPEVGWVLIGSEPLQGVGEHGDVVAPLVLVWMRPRI